MRVPRSDAHAEALALLESAREQGIVVRAIGGLAIHIACPSSRRPPLERAYKDIDLVGLSRQRGPLEAWLADAGYEADAGFNLLSAHGQLYFRDRVNARQLDVFLDRMTMCHTLDLHERLELAELTVSPTDLLLSKLQVYETNERDLKDAAALLLDCEIDTDYIASLLGRDWGWWRTVTEVLQRLDSYVAELELDNRAELRERIDELRTRVNAEPKARRWKLRSRVGDRVRWYELPEDDHVDQQ